MQRKLSLWAEKDKEHKFFDLYHLLYDKDWLCLAHAYVSQNAGSVTAGCDGINMKDFDENRERNLEDLAKELKAETFEPYPVRRVYIPKSNGKGRPLGIPMVPSYCTSILGDLGITVVGEWTNRSNSVDTLA
jgi:RNA-directed DNA polymerase